MRITVHVDLPDEVLDRQQEIVDGMHAAAQAAIRECQAARARRATPHAWRTTDRHGKTRTTVALRDVRFTDADTAIIEWGFDYAAPFAQFPTLTLLAADATPLGADLTPADYLPALRAFVESLEPVLMRPGYYLAYWERTRHYEKLAMAAARWTFAPLHHPDHFEYPRGIPSIDLINPQGGRTPPNEVLADLIDAATKMQQRYETDQVPLFKGPSLDSISRRFWAELETDFVRLALTKGEGLPLAPPAAAALTRGS
jgi:hypothetical protein